MNFDDLKFKGNKIYKDVDTGIEKEDFSNNVNIRKSEIPKLHTDIGSSELSTKHVSSKNSNNTNERSNMVTALHNDMAGHNCINIHLNELIEAPFKTNDATNPDSNNGLI